ncbi:MAG: DUF4178 domain-containing protein [Phototrophicaceae bacterium]|jgi:hypothetical protein
MAEMNCKSCGAPLKIANQFVRSVSCEFCGSSYIVNGSAGLDPTGASAGLADYPSRISIGAQGNVRGRGFTVLGRIRYSYPAGFWDEWQIEWHDGAPPDWLEEDEGYWTIYKRQRVRGVVPSFDEIKVGKTYKIDNYNVFITEKRKAKMLGSDGQFAFVLPVRGEFGFATGSADGQVVNVNFFEDEIALSIGEDLEHHDIKI